MPGEDIFNLKYILCPIKLDNKHWTSAVIFMEDKRIQYYDSMGGTDRSKLEGLLEYVKDEYRAKNCKELDVTEWELVFCTRDTPQQRNGEFVFLGARSRLACLWVLFRILPSTILFLNLGFDRGVFMCMFGDFISKDCPLVFNQDHIDQCWDRIALSIMENCAIEDSQAAVTTATSCNTLAAQAAVTTATSNNTVALALADGDTSGGAIANDGCNDDDVMEVFGRLTPITRESIAKNTRLGGNKKRNAAMPEAENKLMFDYLFDADETQLSEAASGLTELGADSLGVVRYQKRSMQGQWTRKKTRSIQYDDKERLREGGCFNDDLVNFWMCW